MLSGRLLITGGTGSLGTALLARAEKENWNTQISVLARNETKMNRTLARFPNVSGIIGDVRDKETLTTIFPGFDYVIHAAAIKIVPVAESNPVEAVKTNVIGSMNVAQAAIESGIKRVVGVSTDKACGPTYYGLTKRLMEGIFRQANDWGSTDFVLCRYGNVLRSANSVVPLFERQIKENIPFTITHKKMTRFWLSMENALDLVEYTLETANAGQIFVPQAPAMSLVDLALTLDPSREVKFIGIRPGERLHETLIVREELLHTHPAANTAIGNIFIIDPPHIQLKEHVREEYTSENPATYLTSDQIKYLLEDSPLSL